MDAHVSQRRQILDTSGGLLGAAHVETLNVENKFGPWLPAKFSGVDQNLGYLHANQEIVVACREDCTPLCLVLATFLPEENRRPINVYVFMRARPPYYPRYCATKESCDLLRAVPRPAPWM